MDCIDTLVIGGGALGLACAARLAHPDRSLLVVEAERAIGNHTSSRNSEVIHAGLYYAPGSLKAALCLEGRERLYHWCERHQVPHRRLGKLLVAVEDAELGKLESLAANAAACGVGDLQPLDARQLAGLEPAVRGVAALLSPNTGIVDSHVYLQSLLAAAERGGAQLVLDTRVERLRQAPDGWIAEGTSGGEAFRLQASRVINAGGLFAQDLAHATEGLAAAAIPPLRLCQGRYFSYAGRSPFSRLIYPMPEAHNAGLGVHATLDLGGQLRFGPDVRYVDHIDYSVDADLRPAFARAIARYFPGLAPERLSPGYAGVRPQAVRRGGTGRRFRPPKPRRTRPRGAAEPVRHRVARPHRQPGHRRTRRRPARRLTLARAVRRRRGPARILTRFTPASTDRTRP